jgi:hypothetical protein
MQPHPVREVRDRGCHCVAVFTNRSPNAVTETLTYYIIDRLRGREPVAWRERFRQRRDESIANIQVSKDVREKARRPNTRPAHELAAYSSDYSHPAYGVMSGSRRQIARRSLR